MDASSRRLEILLAVVAALLMLAALLLPAMPQPQDYHRFADARTLMGVPRAMDSLSNLPFVLLGAWALLLHATRRLQYPDAALGRAALAFHVGFVLTGLGSFHYHLAPDDAGLAWDRLGMVVTFAGALGLAAAHKVSPRAGTAVLLVALGGGVASVAAWVTTGSVTPYAVCQYGGIALLLASLPLAARQPAGPAWGALLACYALAKACEAADAPVFALTGGWISGHTVKHLAAACAILAVVLPFWRALSRPGQRPGQRPAALSAPRR